MAMTDEERKAKNREYNKKWRENNPDKYKASYGVQNKRRYEMDQADGFKRQREYREKNAESIAARMRVWTQNNRDHLNQYAREQHYIKKYGITIAERDAMVVAQGACCVICKATSPGNKIGWVVDHCHTKGHVRAILCHHCNLALGCAKDDPEILRSMIDYLEKHK